MSTRPGADVQIVNGFPTKKNSEDADTLPITERAHLQTLNKQLADILDNNDTSMAQVESEIVNMKKVLREEIDATKNKIKKGEDELQRDLRASEEENDRLQIELKKYRELYEMDRRARDAMRRELAELRVSLEERDEYKAELFTLKQELQRLREALSNAEVDKKALREEINAVENIHEQQLLLFKYKDVAIRDIRQNYEVNLDRMNSQLHKKDLEISKLQSHLRTYSEKERSWDAWNNEKSTLEAKLTSLRTRLSEKNESENTTEISIEPEIKTYETLVQKVSHRMPTPEKRKPAAPETAPKPTAKTSAANENHHADHNNTEHHVESPTAADQPRPRTCAAFKEKFNGSIKISSATRDYVALQNVGNKDENLDGMMISAEVNGREQHRFTFRQGLKLTKHTPLKIWSKGKRPRTPSINDIEAGDVKYWAEGDNVTIKLKSSKGEERAVLCPMKEDAD